MTLNQNTFSLTTLLSYYETRVEFSDFVNIGNTELVRAKIRDREQRMVLLNNVKRLRNSEQYRFLYIQHCKHPTQ